MKFLSFKLKIFDGRKNSNRNQRDGRIQVEQKIKYLFQKNLRLFIINVKHLQ
jgi:hypothetical protein